MWFEKVRLGTDYNYVSSRIRLVRNLDDYAFPARLSKDEASGLVNKLMEGLSGIGGLEGGHFNISYLNTMPDIDRMTLKERRIINSAAAEKKSPTGIMVSDDESISLILNGDDHIRMQLLSPGQRLEELWDRANKLDDYINERFTYAFDEKYGYLTSYPTNTGTGMRANIVLHLPALSLGRNFSHLMSGIGRFGVAMRGVYGDGRENYGSLYEISNPKTLGQSEKEIIDQVSRVAAQLNAQENQTRSMSLKSHRVERQDEAFKSYGVLKYARKLSLKDSLIYLSSMLCGISDGLINVNEPEAVYGLMIGVQPSNILKLSDKPLSKDELDAARAEYIRRELPELTD